MIGLGTDIIEISRIRKSYERFGDSFLDHVYSKNERELLKNKPSDVQFLAGRFAAKEAIYKSLSPRLEYGIGWKEMEILRASSGLPEVVLSGRAQKRAEELGIKKVMISISHCRDYAVAFVSAL